MGWYVLNVEDHIRIQRMTDAIARLTEVLMQRDLHGRLSALQRLAHHWELDQSPQHKTWEADVDQYIAEQPSYQAIEWADASLHIRWVVPFKGNEAVKDFDITSLPDAWRAALRAQTSRQTVLTPPMTLVQGDRAIAAYVPLFRDNQFAGLLIGVIRVTPWLDGVLVHENESNYHINISIGNNVVYGWPTLVPFADNGWLAERALSMHGLDWSIRVSPTARFVSAIHSRLSTMVLVLGLMLSALLGWIVHSALSAKQQAQELKSSADRLTALLKNLPGMAYRFVNQEKWPAEFVSEGCREMCGYLKSEFEEQHIFWLDLVHPDDRTALWQSVQEIIGSGREYENEYRIITRDGEERWVWCCGRVIDAEEGGPAYLEGLVTDITSRKQAATALVDAESYAKAIVDTAAEAVITINSSGRIETFNRAAQQMFQYSLEQISGAHVRILIPESYNSEIGRYIERFLNRDPSLGPGTGSDINGRRKDGSLFPIHLSVSEVPHLSERKLVGLIRDLSEQRAAEQEAREHRERLAHVDRLNILGGMATGIAHEINQPLSAISMYAQSGIRFLEGDVPKPERLRDALEKLGIQAHRAGAIIERMQQLGKQHESQRETIDGNVLMKEVHNLAETEARIRDMEIELDLCHGSCLIVGDPVQIQQVALNLLRNGMEAMASIARSQDRHIVLSTQRTDEGFTVYVTDRGIGVSKEVAESLYQPFATTKKTGMGLGLSICRSIISAHGGRLGFTNNQHSGATFYFVLPYAPGEN